MKRLSILVSFGLVAILFAAGCQETAVQTTGSAVSTHPAMRVDMPEATSYSGNFGVTLEFAEPNTIFKPMVLKASDADTLITPSPPAFAAAKKGRFDPVFFPNLQWISSDEEQQDAIAALDSLDYTELEHHYVGRKYLVLYRTQAGAMVYDFVKWTDPLLPELFILEEYRLTSHLGDYGTGRIISTLSLLPGEETDYQIENYSATSTKESNTSSIFDSMSEESAESFQSAVMSEESSQEKSSKSFQGSASVSASASWGWGKAKAKASAKVGTNSSREDFARNVSSAVNNHASSASSNRSVEVNSASEHVELKEETSNISKRISNPNLSRTLNFIFYQMNQEYITFLHLVDVSVGLLEANGDVTIVPLYDLQSLLDDGVRKDAHKMVRQRIEEELFNIRDYQGELHGEFVLKEDISDSGTAGEESEEPSRYSYRLAPRYVSTYYEESGRTIRVPGVIIAVNTIVLRTDGVYVDAILGQNSALADVDEQADAARLWNLRHGTAGN